MSDTGVFCSPVFSAPRSSGLRVSLLRKTLDCGSEISKAGQGTHPLTECNHFSVYPPNPLARGKRGTARPFLAFLIALGCLLPLATWHNLLFPVTLTPHAPLMHPGRLFGPPAVRGTGPYRGPWTTSASTTTSPPSATKPTPHGVSADTERLGVEDCGQSVATRWSPPGPAAVPPVLRPGCRGSGGWVGPHGIEGAAAP